MSASTGPEVVQPGLEVVGSKPPVYGEYSPMPQSPHNKGDYAPAALDGPGDLKDEKEERTILGMRGPTFCLFLALVFVVLAAGIGGGVGGTMAVNNARKNAEASAKPVTITELVTATSCSAPTPTTLDASATALSATVPYVAPIPSFVALDCPNLSGKDQLVTVRSTTYTFALQCGQDFGSVDGKTADILATTAYSMKDCIQACATMNNNLRGDNVCKGVAFSAALASSLRANFGNCWLKNSTANINGANKTVQIGATLSLAGPS